VELIARDAGRESRSADCLPSAEAIDR
jgi:hypothetical protein